MTTTVPPQSPGVPADDANQRAFVGYLAGLDGFRRCSDRFVTTLARKEKRVHHALARTTRAVGEATISAADLARTQTDRQRADAEVDDDPRIGPRGANWCPPWLARLFAVLAVVGLFAVDSTMLLFLRLSQTNTRLLAVVIVAASASLAWVYGTHRRTWNDEVYPQVTLGPRHRRTMTTALVLGIGIESGLALIRAVMAAALLTSVLLGAAGVALWITIAYMVSVAHNSVGAVSDRRWRQVKRAARRAERDVACVAKAHSRLTLAQQHLVQAALVEVVQLNEVIDGATAVWTRAHDAPQRPTWPWLSKLEALADGQLPACCTLPPSGPPMARFAIEA